MARVNVYIAKVTRSCDAGHTPSSSPAIAEPIAGVYEEVRARATCGFRRRNGRAEFSSNEARNRKKKRCRRRWKSRMRANEADIRRLDDLSPALGTLRLHLCSASYLILQ